MSEYNNIYAIPNDFTFYPQNTISQTFITPHRPHLPRLLRIVQSTQQNPYHHLHGTTLLLPRLHQVPPKVPHVQGVGEWEKQCEE